MRRDLILQYLYQKSKTLTSHELESEFAISNRTLRNELKELNVIGEKSGFVIQKKRGEGFLLHVVNQEMVQSYLKEMKGALAPDLPRVRVINIIMLLLQTTEFQTIDMFAESLMISRSTVLSDMVEVEKLVRIFDLKVETKSRYGVRLLGDETNFRRAFSYFLSQKETGLLKKSNYLNFEKAFPFEEIRTVLSEEVQNNHLKLSYFALENILGHIQILSFRVTQHNFILPNQEKNLDVSLIKPSYMNIAKRICEILSELYHVLLPESEIIYLAAHLSGKSSVDDIEEQEKNDLKQKLKQCLEKLDQTFLTQFTGDQQLLDNLLMHMYPLLRRLYFNLKLSNPLIDDVYSRYSDVFMIALKFSEMIKEIWGFELSSDEMGYLTMHFAAHMEREKQKQLSSYKKILLSYGSGAGSADLLKMKLATLFQGATIEIVLYSDLQTVHLEEYDLLVSSIPIRFDNSSIPYIQVGPILSETDIQRIRRTLTRYPASKVKENVPSLLSLFHSELFYIEESRESFDYKAFIKEKAKRVVELGFATPDYPDLVVEREEKISTILQNGIAVPHALKMVAIQDSVSVVIFKNPPTYDGKVVQILFLINLRAGDLFLHKELSRLVLQLMDHPEAKQRILKSNNFNDFQYEISKILFC
ncbi:PRD domain-containing protein [Neobacillus sp. OS1-33]|jgi:lichenan operon transcriptional antiterminator|uniref:BglG family transcription antiterminator n=1 Tax=Neobacillus sp. OS1-33 TaxID=3070683 RepID=UPI0027DEE9C8|nr:PRD domain-containing protein [Neobacillus sp. OS1-33]WML27213.1 PRD domain-containing protein [Neobacillus sp. OS1-33]